MKTVDSNRKKILPLALVSLSEYLTQPSSPSVSVFKSLLERKYWERQGKKEKQVKEGKQVKREHDSWAQFASESHLFFFSFSHVFHFTFPFPVEENDTDFILFLAAIRETSYRTSVKAVITRELYWKIFETRYSFQGLHLPQKSVAVLSFFLSLSSCEWFLFHTNGRLKSVSVWKSNRLIRDVMMSCCVAITHERQAVSGARVVMIKSQRDI